MMIKNSLFIGFKAEKGNPAVQLLEKTKGIMI